MKDKQIIKEVEQLLLKQEINKIILEGKQLKEEAKELKKEGKRLFNV